VNGSVVLDGREVWAQAERGNGKIWIRIVEKGAMKQHVVADAAAMSNDLRATGHVAVYGIFFDTGKAVVKPESKAALDEVAKLLKAEPGLKLWVVGHTDWVGKVDDNMRLAQARAEAVAAEWRAPTASTPRASRATARGRSLPWRATTTRRDGRRTGAWSWSSSLIHSPARLRPPRGQRAGPAILFTIAGHSGRCP